MGPLNPLIAAGVRPQSDFSSLDISKLQNSSLLRVSNIGCPWPARCLKLPGWPVWNVLAFGRGDSGPSHDQISKPDFEWGPFGFRVQGAANAALETAPACSWAEVKISGESTTRWTQYARTVPVLRHWDSVRSHPVPIEWAD